MGRQSNFDYQRQPEALGVGIGQSLARALFGDPVAAQAQAEAQAKLDYYGAQSEEARAHAGLYGKQAEGVGIQNGASQSLPELIASLAPRAPAASPVAMRSDPLAAPPEQPAPPAFDAAAFRAGLPAVIAALGQIQGDKVDPRHSIGAFSAFTGDDALGRAGLIAQGQTPSKEFALTSERADAIAKQRYGADYRSDTAVASINHATDIPIANIKAGADRDVARIKGTTDRDVANIRGKAGGAKGDTRSPKPIGAAAYRMLFGVTDDPDEPGELATQARQRGYNLSRDAETRLRLQVIRNYQQTGNPVDAVLMALENVQRNIEGR